MTGLQPHQFSAASPSPTHFLDFLNQFKSEFKSPHLSRGIYTGILHYMTHHPIDADSASEALYLLVNSFCSDPSIGAVLGDKRFLLGQEPSLPWPHQISAFSPAHFGNSFVDFDAPIAVLMALGANPWLRLEEENKKEFPVFSSAIHWMLARDAGRLLQRALELPYAKEHGYTWKTLMEAKLPKGLNIRGEATWWDYMCSARRFDNYAGNVIDLCFKNNCSPAFNESLTGFPLVGCHPKVSALSIEYGVLPESEKFITRHKDRWEQHLKDKVLTSEQVQDGLMNLADNNLLAIEDNKIEKLKTVILSQWGKAIDFERSHEPFSAEKIDFNDLTVPVPLTLDGIEGQWSYLSASLWRGITHINGMTNVEKLYKKFGEDVKASIDEQQKAFETVVQQPINEHLDGGSLLSLFGTMIHSPVESKYWGNRIEKIYEAAGMQLPGGDLLKPFIDWKTNKTQKMLPLIHDLWKEERKKIMTKAYTFVEKAFFASIPSTIKLGTEDDNNTKVFSTHTVPIIPENMPVILDLISSIAFHKSSVKKSRNLDPKEIQKVAFALNELSKKTMATWINELPSEEKASRYSQWYGYYLENRNLNNLGGYTTQEPLDVYKARLGMGKYVAEQAILHLSTVNWSGREASLERLNVIAQSNYSAKDKEGDALLRMIHELQLNHSMVSATPVSKRPSVDLGRF